MKCEAITCLYNNKDKCSFKEFTIGPTGKCKSYVKGVLYYLLLFASRKSNFITMYELNDDLRYSIYYWMKCFPCCFSYQSRIGGVILCRSDNKQIINPDDIIPMIQSDEFNWDVFHSCNDELKEKGLPKANKEDENMDDVESKEYGWLAPNGDFIPSPWGTHEETAEDIVEKNNWEDDWLEYKKGENVSSLFRDYLVFAKGYVLIDDPCGTGYHVTHSKNLTKKQKDFLYGYFMDMGMKWEAESYIDD